MGELKLHRRDGQQVRALLESGEFSHIETAAEELTDEFLLFAISSGLLAQWATTFPDPRAAAQIPMPVLLAASLAARFAKVYSLRKSGYVLRSARVLGALGYSVEEVESGAGISDRGTEEEAICSADVLRKLLVQLERQVTIAETPPTAVPAPEVEGAAAQVKVRQRLSRRAVKQQINEQESAARARAAAAELVGWYNRVVGPSLLEYAALGPGRRLHLLDTTEIKVTLACGNYECSGVVKTDEGELVRGYKLATLRSLLDQAGIVTQVEVGPIHRHDLELCRELLHHSPVLRRGDLLIEDRGFIDGELITYLKRERGVDCILPLRANMESYKEAVVLAEQAAQWRPHPSRAGQEIAWVRGVEHVWDSCQVRLNACVIRYWHKRRQALDYIVLVTTDEQLNEVWTVRHYEARPEVEQDYQQLKSGGWYLQKLVTTRYTEIVYYLLTVVLAYSLYQLFANTQAGQKFAGKTRQQIEFEQMKTNLTQVIVYAGGYFEIFETLSFARLLLGLSREVQEKLGSWLDEILVGRPVPT